MPAFFTALEASTCNEGNGVHMDIGDDGPDLPVMEQVGFAVAVNDAHPLVKRIAHYTTLLPGGFGAVRELTDLLMLAQGHSLGTQGSST